MTISVRTGVGYKCQRQHGRADCKDCVPAMWDGQLLCQMLSRWCFSCRCPCIGECLDAVCAYCVMGTWEGCVHCLLPIIVQACIGLIAAHDHANKHAADWHAQDVISAAAVLVI